MRGFARESPHADGTATLGSSRQRRGAPGSPSQVDVEQLEGLRSDGQPGFDRPLG